MTFPKIIKTENNICTIIKKSGIILLNKTPGAKFVNSIPG